MGENMHRFAIIVSVIWDISWAMVTCSRSRRRTRRCCHRGHRAKTSRSSAPSAIAPVSAGRARQSRGCRSTGRASSSGRRAGAPRPPSVGGELRLRHEARWASSCSGSLPHEFWPPGRSSSGRPPRAAWAPGGTASGAARRPDRRPGRALASPGAASRRSPDSPSRPAEAWPGCPEVPEAGGPLAGVVGGGCGRLGLVDVVPGVGMCRAGSSPSVPWLVAILAASLALGSTVKPWFLRLASVSGAQRPMGIVAAMAFSVPASPEGALAHRPCRRTPSTSRW